MADQSPLFIVMAGGTGGHIFPALAVADELRDQGSAFTGWEPVMVWRPTWCQSTVMTSPLCR